MRLMPRTRFGVAWRAVLALVLCVGAAAAATATAGLMQVKQVVNELNLSKGIVSRHLTPPAPGAPETLLLVGVDHRYGQGGGVGNTDTMMLVRINDSSSTINVLSIPRDLGVNIPGVGFSKINAAYADGGSNGANLLLQTLQQDVFPGLQVNHVFLIDFQSFANLIGSLGCIYSQVDHRYYNHSVGPADPATNFSSIDIQPGYQALCGGPHDDGGPTSALAFVRFRHNDSDFVRQSRQQDFLRWAKEQFSASELLANKTKLIDNFGLDVQTDQGLHSTDQVDELFGLAFNADGGTLKTINFPFTGTQSGAIGNYVTFSQSAAAQAYQELMTPTQAGASTTTTPTTPTSPGKAGGKARRKPKRTPFKLPAYMAPDVADGTSQAAHLGSNPGLPVYFPKDIPTNYVYCFALTGNCDEPTNPSSAYVNSYPRSYSIDYKGTRYPSYAMTLVRGSGSVTDMGTGEYFTVQGTTWTGSATGDGPPILRHPTAIKVVNGKTLDEYVQGGEMTLVAWHTPGAVYWISNTIQNDIPAAQMVAMAASFMRAPGA